jgi:hypothetical protein
MMTLSTIKDGSIAAIHDTKVGVTIGVSTIFAGVTASQIAVYVGIMLSTLLAIKTLVDIHLSIKKSRHDDLHATLRQETEHARRRAIQKAESLGQPARRESDK